jgi:hypothetical protein
MLPVRETSSLGYPRSALRSLSPHTLGQARLTTMVTVFLQQLQTYVTQSELHSIHRETFTSLTKIIIVFEKSI